MGPRDIHAQRLAAELVRDIPLLRNSGHIGRVVDVITGCGIDPGRWRARDVVVEINRDTRDQGWTWPTHVTNSVAFLRYRLARIDWSKPSPTETAAKAAEKRADERAARAAAAATQTPASAETRRRAYAAVFGVKPRITQRKAFR